MFSSAASLRHRNPKRQRGKVPRRLLDASSTPLRLKEDVKAVVVTEVEPGFPATRAGIMAKDVIVRIGRTEVHSVADYRAAMKDQNLQAGVRLQVVRDGSNRFIFIKISQ